MKQEKHKRLEAYLSQVDSYLQVMPAFEKTDILSELKNSFYERLHHGQSEESVIADLGSPKALAMGYIGESMIAETGFSLTRLMKLIGFYSYASMMWLSAIPVLAVFALSFFLSSVVCVLAGMMGLLKGIVDLPLLDQLRFVFFMNELRGLPALLVGWLLAILFVGLAILCWKGTVQLVRHLSVKNWQFRYKRA